MSIRITPILLLASASSALAEEPTREQVDFFESKIRPILVDACYRCHSEEAGESKGSLFLDTRAGLLAGGDSGPAIVPGEPEKSLLLEVVRREDEDFAMPPKKKEALTAAQVADLEAWVKMGAPDPRTGEKALTEFEKILEKAGDHWAFQPVANPKVPEVRQPGIVQSDIDAFILAKLENEGLEFSPPAPKRELIRRAYFDLIGLPPTSEQVAAFEEDVSSDAFAKVVEELLASPHYGERWGRHWLDVARYADTAGREGNGRTYYHHAHTYRDYVIRAFNEDLPFDRFIVEQLAADHLDLPDDDNRALAALGFLTVGRKMNGKIDDNSRDDMIDVVTRGFLGLTAACARCHDHKLEPISTRDYYSLYGIIRSSKEAAVPPELRPQPVTPARADYLARNLAARRELIRAHAFEAERIFTEFHSRVGDYLQAVQDGDYKGFYHGEKQKQIVRRRNLQQLIFGALAVFWKQQVVGHPELFRPWLELSALEEGQFPSEAAKLCQGYAENADGSLNAAVAAGFKGLEPANFQDVVYAYNRIFAQIEKKWGDRLRAVLLADCEPTEGELGLPKTTYGYEKPAELALDRVLATYKSGVIPQDDPLSKLLAWLTQDRNGFALTGDSIRRSRVLTRDVARGLRRDISSEMDAVAAHPGAPVRAMALVDTEKPYDAKVFIRGNAENLGADAPRQFLSILSGTSPEPFPAGTSGRLELARSIVDPSNPLTARVIVNRVWHWHFGEGIVRTPSDFGMQGEAPTHPELLDYLAARFVREGWSLKKLHSWLMLSTTYQQDSRPVPGAEQRDPENRLWRRMNPRRLEFEPFRDSLLAVSRKLDPETRGGKAIDISSPGAPPIRTVYGEVDRKTLPNLFATFDFPDPTSSADKRLRNALTPESLFLLNSPFITDTAKEIARQVMPTNTHNASLTEPGFTGIHNADPRKQSLVAVEHKGQRYPQLQAAARAIAPQVPQLFGSQREGMPWSLSNAVADLDITSGVRDISQIDLFLNRTVNHGARTGFFIVQAQRPGAPSLPVSLLPLDMEGNPIGEWKLLLKGERFGEPLGKVQEIQGHFTPRIATFSLADFSTNKPAEPLSGVRGLRLTDDDGSVGFDLVAGGTFSMVLPILVTVDDDFRPFRHETVVESGVIGWNAFGSVEEALHVLDPTQPSVIKIHSGVYPEIIDLSVRTNPVTVHVIGQVQIHSLSGALQIEDNGELLTATKLGPEVFQDRSHRFGVTKLYRQVFQRDPSENEVRNALNFLSAYPVEENIHPETLAWTYGSGSVDETGFLTEFTPIPFRGGKVRGAGNLELTSTGGWPSASKAAVRRWTAPYSGTVNISGELSHLPAKPGGDGVECYVVSGRSGRIGKWTAQNHSLSTLLRDIRVIKGETIDFVTVARKDNLNDGFEWAPSITMYDRDVPSMPGIPMRWDARNDFASPDNFPTQLGPWEELTQVLLISNEFAFID